MKRVLFEEHSLLLLLSWVLSPFTLFVQCSAGVTKCRELVRPKTKNMTFPVSNPFCPIIKGARFRSRLFVGTIGKSGSNRGRWPRQRSGMKRVAVSPITHKQQGAPCLPGSDHPFTDDFVLSSLNKPNTGTHDGWQRLSRTRITY
jgi:hypothetical protein